MSKKRALVSVSDKSGVVTFAKELTELGYEVISTGGTAKALEKHNVPVTYVSDVTGFPEILEGRVKTLHPKVHGGILAKRTPEHLTQLEENNITPIDIVAVNLYPFKETIAKPDVTLEDAIENIDIGGPAMVRAAAKNNDGVAIIVNPDKYESVIAELKNNGEISKEKRFSLAAEAFKHTADYDSAIAGYLAEVNPAEQAEAKDLEDDKAVSFPEYFKIKGKKLQGLRYGENPQQAACFYGLLGDGANVTNAKQLQGKELSFNNIVDANAALELVKEYDHTAAVVIKHTNPCGASEADDQLTAYKQAYEADAVSAFGGIVAFNRVVEAATAAEMAKTFLEVIIAPDFSDEAKEILGAKENLRLMAVGDFAAEQSKGSKPEFEIKSVAGGFLLQEVDKNKITKEDLKVVTEAKPDDKLLQELLFAWKTVKHVKSNAIVVTKDGVTVGVGAGQMNRVGSAKIAFEQAGEKAKGAVLASDAFFPFADTVENAAKAGIKAIIQPGGSKKDEESIAEANKHGIVMVFTGQRHFKH